MCCIGCCAVAEMLEAQGLGDWYRLREGPTGRPADPVQDVLDSLRLAEPLADSPSESTSAGHGERATLLVEGITCAACVWLIETHLERFDGVIATRVDLTSHRVHLEWSRERTSLAAIVARLAEIGFSARPDHPDIAADIEKSENRSALIRLGIAGLGTMNVMTYSVALYAGAFEGIEHSYWMLFRWLALLVTTPVVLIGARPFFAGALRDLRIGRPGMDVPVALAIAGGLRHQCVGDLARRRQRLLRLRLYVHVLLECGGRYLEMRSRHHAARLSRRLDRCSALDRTNRPRATRNASLRRTAWRSADRFLVRPGRGDPSRRFDRGWRRASRGSSAHRRTVAARCCFPALQ